MKLKELKLTDKSLFDEFLGINEYYLSAYHFCNIFIWRRLFRIFYVVLEGRLCIFFKDNHSCFMYLPPLGRKPDLSVIKKSFAIMDEFNNNKEVCRIENVEEKYLAHYQGYGYTHSIKAGDYLYKRRDIASLRGNKFKSKRASYNYFVKHHDFKFRPYHKQDALACLGLYHRWAEQRRNKLSDPLYQGMLEDNLLCQKEAMQNSSQLGIIGHVIEIQNEIAGYIFGFPLNPRTFCIVFEVCDLTYRGISQFIFSEFCRQLSDYQYINVMDDSGLQNLRKVKLSYRPISVVANYIITRQVNEQEYQ